MDAAKEDLRQALSAGAANLGLSLNHAQIDKLLAYQALINKWTRVYNLTSVRDPAEMLTHHLLDSLAVIAPLQRHLQAAEMQAARLLDVGSGAGLPGVVIAVCCPQVQVTSVDTVAKKSAFVKQVAVELRLPNLSAVQSRVEAISQPFDVICSRAFASLADFVRLSRSALAPGGVWLAMKGKHPAEELAELPDEVEVFHVEQLTVPGLFAERCIVWMRSVS